MSRLRCVEEINHKSESNQNKHKVQFALSSVDLTRAQPLRTTLADVFRFGVHRKIHISAFESGQFGFYVSIKAVALFVVRFRFPKCCGPNWWINVCVCAGGIHKFHQIQNCAICRNAVRISILPITATSAEPFRHISDYENSIKMKWTNNKCPHLHSQIYSA